MILDLIMAMLWSLSPFGEAKVGIPFGIMKGLNQYVVFIFCFLANIAVFPLMMFFLDKINRYFLKWRFYKKSALFIAKRAKTGSGNKIERFGFLGLVLFVMIPLPGTGVYAGSIASYLFKIERKQAFLANTTGIFFSSLIVWLIAVFSTNGV
ncbi:COG2426 family protein [Flagellimonas sp. S174]|uniref:COG2426 family protein n=1 Tax=Flagellimonas sp. S174 TaxID=3410790 RepID=UPI002631C23C|nr:small multi-drug export protein [uncultured Allomuricauda sp.]